MVSLAAFIIPMVAELRFAELIGHCQALVWLFAVIPSFLLAYYRGWAGVATALAAAMAALSLTQVGVLLTVGHIESWPLVLVVVVIFCTFAVAIGLTTEQLHAQRATAELLALTDELTSLPNRRFAERILDREFAAAQRGRPLTVALFDLDNFKDYNDTFGHAAGDKALEGFSGLLHKNTRDMDFSARYGGEEFLTILCNCDLDGGLKFVERVRRDLQNLELGAGPLTVSVGVATFHPQLASRTELLAAADQALYQAKQEGRDRVRVAPATPGAAPGAGDRNREPGTRDRNHDPEARPVGS